MNSDRPTEPTNHWSMRVSINSLPIVLSISFLFSHSIRSSLNEEQYMCTVYSLLSITVITKLIYSTRSPSTEFSWVYYSFLLARWLSTRLMVEWVWRKWWTCFQTDNRTGDLDSFLLIWSRGKRTSDKETLEYGTKSAMNTFRITNDRFSLFGFWLAKNKAARMAVQL